MKCANSDTDILKLESIIFYLENEAKCTHYTKERKSRSRSGTSLAWPVMTPSLELLAVALIWLHSKTIIWS